jgi:hypothetical protein
MEITLLCPHVSKTVKEYEVNFAEIQIKFTSVR